MKSSGSHRATQITQKIHAHQRIYGLKNCPSVVGSIYRFFTWIEIQHTACLPKPLPQFQNEVRGNWHFYYKAFICRLCRLQMASIFELDNFLCTFCAHGDEAERERDVCKCVCARAPVCVFIGKWMSVYLFEWMCIDFWHRKYIRLPYVVYENSCIQVKCFCIFGTLRERRGEREEDVANAHRSMHI